jgi:tetratricopeptide (TPR) repeat protein
MDLGRTGAAEQSFLKAIDLDASNLVAMRGLASLARERGDEAGARLWFQRISGLEPETPAAVEPLPPTEEVWWTPDGSGADDEESADPSEAWWFEDPAEARSSDDGDLLTRTMAELYEKQGLIAEAIAIYKELLEDRPEDVELIAAVERAEGSLAAVPAVERTEAPETSPAAAAVTTTPGTSGHSEVFLDWLRSLGN